MILGTVIFIRQRNGWTITDGKIFMLYFLQTSIIQRARMLNRSLDMTMRMNITAERLNPLFTNDTYLPEKSNHTISKKHPGSIEMVNCSFAYKNNHLTLNNVSLTISAGETVGFVGVTGSGKSTLALLLCRFYDPIQGKILLDGRNIAHYAIQDVRDRFSLIFQETFLFSASIRDNIAYGRPFADDKEIINVAKLAQIHDFIKDLPQGYDTLVGERGVTLSGGQQQRMSIARALLRKPQFIIFDDCTSALDSKTEYALQQGLDSLNENIIKIIITHRMSSIKNADTIYVIDKGSIVERGTHSELNIPGTAFRRILRPDSEENGK
jgi:ABC-type multidrug transport system fused ATPase/permease subunit